MSILDRINDQNPAGKKLFGVIAGQRLAGKTTIVGTLPGRTLLVQAAVLESGSESAKKLAAQLGNKLDVLNFASLEELSAICEELKKDKLYDNVVVDSLSAVTEMKHSDPAIQKLIKSGRDGTWSAFREIGRTATTLLLALKNLTYPDGATKPKNTWLTCALDVKAEAGGDVKSVVLDCKGNVAASEVTRLGEAVVIVLPPIQTDAGRGKHRLLTRNFDPWPARIDGILEQDNPGIIEPASLASVLALKGENT